MLAPKEELVALSSGRWLGGIGWSRRDGATVCLWFVSFILLTTVLRWKDLEEAEKMERMESMEPISAYYTTAYPEIHPESAQGSGESTDNQLKTPPAPVYDEDLTHKVGQFGYNYGLLR